MDNKRKFITITDEKSGGKVIIFIDCIESIYQGSIENGNRTEIYLTHGEENFWRAKESIDEIRTLINQVQASP